MKVPQHWKGLTRLLCFTMGEGGGEERGCTNVGFHLSDKSYDTAIQHIIANSLHFYEVIIFIEI